MVWLKDMLQFKGIFLIGCQGMAWLWKSYFLGLLLSSNSRKMPRDMGFTLNCGIELKFCIFIESQVKAQMKRSEAVTFVETWRKGKE
jgi:hypothetical protein